MPYVPAGDPKPSTQTFSSTPVPLKTAEQSNAKFRTPAEIVCVTGKSNSQGSALVERGRKSSGRKVYKYIGLCVYAC